MEDARGLRRSDRGDCDVGWRDDDVLVRRAARREGSALLRRIRRSSATRGAADHLAEVDVVPVAPQERESKSWSFGATLPQMAVPDTMKSTRLPEPVGPPPAPGRGCGSERGGSAPRRRSWPRPARGKRRRRSEATWGPRSSNGRAGARSARPSCGYGIRPSGHLRPRPGEGSRVDEGVGPCWEARTGNCAMDHAASLLPPIRGWKEIPRERCPNVGVERVAVSQKPRESWHILIHDAHPAT